MNTEPSDINLARLERYLLNQYGLILNTEGKLDSARVRAKALSAYTVQLLTECSIQNAATAVTDGMRDNGIDAIHYQQDTNILYFIQSKWKINSDGHLSITDVKKLLAGVEAIMSDDYSSFNAEILARQAELSSLVRNANTKFRIVISCTTTKRLDNSPDAYSELKKYIATVSNDSDTFDFIELNINDLFNKSPLINPAPIKHLLLIEGCHKVNDPYEAYYGKVDLAHICSVYEEHGIKIFDKNLRKFLGGSTPVNTQIKSTIHNESNLFWYFNNGITIICSNLKRKPYGGKNGPIQMFELTGMNIVNGAQTVGSAYSAYKADPTSVENAYVHVKLISLEKAPPDLAIRITKTTNSQNQISAKDFVSLDELQQNLSKQLLMEGIIYRFRGGEEEISSRREININDATVALACATGVLRIAVIAKNKVSSLWDIDAKNSNYSKVFPRSLSATRLYRVVQLKKFLDEAIDKIVDAKKQEDFNPLRQSRKSVVGDHGSIFMLYHLMKKIKLEEFDRGICSDINIEFEKAVKLIPSAIEDVYEAYLAAFNLKFPPMVFKSLSACEELEIALKNESTDRFFGDLFAFAAK